MKNNTESDQFDPEASFKRFQRDQKRSKPKSRPADLLKTWREDMNVIWPVENTLPFSAAEVATLAAVLSKGRNAADQIPNAISLLTKSHSALRHYNELLAREAPFLTFKELATAVAADERTTAKYVETLLPGKIKELKERAELEDKPATHWLRYPAFPQAIIGMIQNEIRLGIQGRFKKGFTEIKKTLAR